MRHNPKHEVTDPRVVRDLIAENPWATIVSSNEGTLVASHYPVLLDDSDDGLVIVTHVGRYGNPALAADMQRALSPAPS